MIPAYIADHANRKRKREDEIEQRIGDAPSIYYDDELLEPDEDDEEVIDAKGSSAPKSDPQAEANAQMSLERERARLASEETQRAEAKAATEKAAKVDKARGIQGNVYNQAINYDDEQIGARGLNSALAQKYGLSTGYESALNRARGGLAEDDINPANALNMEGLFNTQLSNVTNRYRSDLTNQLNGIAPDRFEYDAFKDTADDDYLATILGTRKADAQSVIDAAKARGQLNDVGYGRAQTGLGEAESIANADLQDLGGGVLSGYRKQLSDMRNNELTRVGGADLTNPYNFSNFENTLSTTKSDLMKRLTGDLTRAVGSKTFFDPSKIIGQAGALQGYYNPAGTANPNAQAAAGGADTNALLDAFKTNTTGGVF